VRVRHLDLLTLQETAELLGKKPELLRTWRHRGIGPRSSKIGRTVVYLRGDVEEWQRLHQPEAETA
jgi:predicted DNA-binding transcriptional regulator AlpA